MKISKSTLFKNVLRDQDERGEILSIVDHNVSNVSIINCNANTIRSNHYHLSDWHIMHVLSGKIDYFYKEIDSNEINYLEVKKGDNIFTPSLEVHATYFPVKTKLIVSSLNPRDQETYEKDTIRVEFVNFNNVNELLKIHSK
tara:strand:- start:2006 stop:2431 length:426 start_codon:yes stop_codon:yes gene_type:complete